ncbi:DUF3667 domain-containing protein [Spirosoma soli]|uniref:DUF3667 domain-containing protein n=1 Tax=Spirosoma soli TaxID=1770529 RepID=A0ABW5LW61_9BACT
MTSATSTTHVHDHSVTGGLVNCQNCDHEYVGRYCSQCGQRADTHPVNWHYIWHEIPHSVWHVDHGIVYTLRQLLTRPGHTIREFLEGKRVNHYRPLALLLMLGAVLLFVQHGLGVSYMKASQEMLNSKDASAGAQAFQAELNQWIERNQNLLYILMIPFFAFGYRLMFRRQRYNYPEMLVAQTFITNIHLLLSLAIVVLFWALGGSVAAFKIVMWVSAVAMLGYNVIVYYQLFQRRVRFFSVVWRSIIGYAIGYLSFFAFGMLILIGYFIYSAVKDPSAFKSQKPTTTVQQPHK